MKVITKYQLKKLHTARSMLEASEMCGPRWHGYRKVKGRRVNRSNCSEDSDTAEYPALGKCGLREASRGATVC